MKRVLPSIVLIGAMVVFLFGGSLLSMAAVGTDNPTDDKQAKKDKKKEKSIHHQIVVTATSSLRDKFEIPQTVSVINDTVIRRLSPNNVAELLPQLPGVDITGVGPNQSRPVIRGLRGQRILLMQDGLRLNNSRRQQGFGEIPALVDISNVERVEIIRGPSSVLYGSDAIGGVLNIISRAPDYRMSGSSIGGRIGYRFNSSGPHNKGFLNLNGHIGPVGFALGGSYSKGNNYQAPAGTFGAIVLPGKTEVKDTGVQDYDFNFYVNYKLSESSRFSLSFDQYHGKDTGFGFVEPEAFDAGAARIQINYPDQKVQKSTFLFENRQLHFFLADHLNFKIYYLRNRRQLNKNIFIPMEIPHVKRAGMSIESENFTDVATLGLRMELSKGLKDHVLTYGLDFFNDQSENSDINRTQMFGFGPPQPAIDTTPQLPNANYRSLGLFFQDEVTLISRASLILGLRYQNVRASTENTRGLESANLVSSTDHTLAGAANLIIKLNQKLRLVLSAGRGFRSPNLIERFFNGPIPEGSGFQSSNLDLMAETSFNLDLGFKYRWKYLYLEAGYFFNTIFNGIRLALTGKMMGRLPEYQNINIDRLRIQGFESLMKLVFPFGLSLSANYTTLDSKDLRQVETPYIETYSSKFNFGLRFQPRGKSFWFGYQLRVNGRQKDFPLIDNPIGPFIPGFTLHSINLGFTVNSKSSFPQQINIVFENLSDVLYAEFANAAFFRPSPGRCVKINWTASF